jgi:hypothetical protein
MGPPRPWCFTIGWDSLCDKAISNSVIRLNVSALVLFNITPCSNPRITLKITVIKGHVCSLQFWACSCLYQACTRHLLLQNTMRDGAASMLSADQAWADPTTRQVTQQPGYEGPRRVGYVQMFVLELSCTLSSPLLSTCTVTWCEWSCLLVL